MSNLSDFMGGGVKSVQRGIVTSVSSSTTRTISAVNPDKTIVALTCTGSDYVIGISLVDATTIELSHIDPYASISGRFTWHVIEFN